MVTWSYLLMYEYCFTQNVSKHIKPIDNGHYIHFDIALSLARSIQIYSMFMNNVILCYSMFKNNEVKLNIH